MSYIHNAAKIQMGILKRAKQFSSSWNVHKKSVCKNHYGGQLLDKFVCLLDILLFLKMLRTTVLAVRNTLLTNIPKGFSSEMSLEVA